MIKLRIVIFFLLKLRLLYVIDSLMMKMLKDTVSWLRLVRVFLYDTRLSAVNLAFDQVITCNDKTQIKLSVSESIFLTLQLYCLSVLSMTVASLLIRVDIRSSTSQDVDLSSTEIRLELLFCIVDINQNCLKLNS